MKTFECAYCKKTFSKRGFCKNYTPKFCNMECYSKSLRKDRWCPVCGCHVKWMNKTFCSKSCTAQDQIGKKLSDSHRERLSQSKKGRKIPHLHNEKIREKISNSLKGKPQVWNRGTNHPRYKDGGKACHARQKEMALIEYKNWRRLVFERDDYTCKFCGKRGVKIHADHILPWSSYPEHRYDINNGRTLCVQCHIKTDTWGGRSKLPVCGKKSKKAKG